MPGFDVVWHGGLVGFVNGWSKTKGELSPSRAQKERPAGWVPPPPEQVDTFGLPRQAPAQSRAQVSASSSNGAPARVAVSIFDDDPDWFINPYLPDPPSLLD